MTFYVQVSDLQKYLDRAESLGGKTIMPPTEIPGMVTMAMFTDPEGNVIGMVKEEAPPAKKKASKRKPKARQASPQKGGRARSRGK